MDERENAMLVLNGEIPEWVPDFRKISIRAETYAVLKQIDESNGGIHDIFGVSFVKTPEGLMPANTRTRQFELTDILEWKSVLKRVDLGKVDLKEETEKKLKKIKAQNGDDLDHKIINSPVAFLWEEMHHMMGFDEALYSLAAEPEATKDFLNALADLYIDCLTEQFRFFKPDMAMVVDHVANSNGLLMGPDAFRRIIKPAEQKVFKAVQDMGIICEVHVDGYIEEILEDYVEMGVKVIQPFQVFNDIEAAKEKYGLIAIGGWDAWGPGNAENASEEAVRQSVRDSMDKYAPTGRYMFWNSGVVANDLQKLEWMSDEAAKYGRTFYR